MLFLQVIDVIARVDWTADPKQLVILLFCKNVKTSRTVLLRVHGVKPYFYVQSSGSDHYNTSKAIHKAIVPRIRRLDHDKSVKRTVERAIENGEDEMAADDAGERTKWAIKINEGGWTKTMPFTKYDDAAEDRVCAIERLADISDKTWFPLIGYTDTPLTGIYKVSVRVPHLVRIARDVIATGTMKESGLTTDVYNTDLDAAQQFMVDHNIRGGGIFSLDEEILCPTPQNLPASMVETEGIEGLDMQSTDSARSVDVPAADMAPLFETMMSFDIEVAGEPEVFPYANKALYPIIQISASSASTGTSYEDATAGRGVRNIVFCLHETADISEHVPGGAEIQWFDDEYEMNIAFRNHVVHDVDPDIITGWNIEDFDFQYMVTRALVKGWDDLARSWSRLATFATSNYEKTFESSAFGRRESNRTTIPGRIVMDGLEAFRREFKLRSYKLDFVAMHFLKEGKEDVHHTEITPLWKSGDPEKRARLAVYCLYDAFLVLRLMILRQLWMQTRSLSDVGKVVGGTTVSRGQSIRVKSMVMHDANIPDDAGAVYLAPYVPHEGGVGRARAPRSRNSRGRHCRGRDRDEGLARACSRVSRRHGHRAEEGILRRASRDARLRRPLPVHHAEEQHVLHDVAQQGTRRAVDANETGRCVQDAHRRLFRKAARARRTAAAHPHEPDDGAQSRQEGHGGCERARRRASAHRV